MFDELKSVANTLREADKIPQYEQILAVQEKLLEMQKKIGELENENIELYTPHYKLGLKPRSL